MRRIKKYLCVLVTLCISTCFSVLLSCGKKSDSHIHNYEETVVQPTCTEQGYTLHKCTCGAEYKDNYTTASHNYEETVVQPTCTEQGYTLHKCACGDEYKDNYTNAISHNFNEYGVCLNCSYTRQIEVKVYIDGAYSQSVYTDSSQNYRITTPEKPEDMTTNPNSEKYFYCWFVDSNFQTPLTESTTFKSNSAVYAKWITVYSSSYTYTVNRGEATITGYSGGTPTVLVIPAYLNSFPVKSIATDAFKGRTQVRKVIICNGIESISGFNGCNSITDIEIPNSVKYIDTNCFARCSFKTFTIPDNITFIGPYAFYNCTSLTSIEIPDSITYIGGEAFYNCTSLTSIEIPDSVTSIGSAAFGYCTSLTSIKIPNGIDRIWNSTFEGCWELTSIEIPSGVTAISEFAFDNCLKLENVIWNAENCTVAGSNSNPIFESCKKLKSVSFGNKVKIIPKYALKSCKEITSITIPSSITTIGEAAFDSCCSPIFDGSYKLKSVSFGNKVKTIPERAFYHCTSLTSVKMFSGVTTIGSYAFYYCQLESLEIPNSVTAIGSYAFSYNWFESVKIPSGVTSIERGTFSECWLTSVEIPNSVTTIGDSAFSGCHLTSVEIPNSVTTIGYSAFSGCWLKNIKIPNSVTTIGKYAFHVCSRLTSVEIPSSVTTIGDSAFEKCTKLNEIHYAGTVEQWKQLVKSALCESNYVVYCTDGKLNKYGIKIG